MRIRLTSRQKNSLLSVFFILVATAVFAVVGGSALKDIFSNNEVRDLHPEVVVARVTDTSEKTDYRATKSGKLYTKYIQEYSVEYEWKGNKYNYVWQDELDSKLSIAPVYDIDGRVALFINPDDPTDAVVANNYRNEHNWATVIGTGVFWLVVVLVYGRIALKGIRSRGSRRQVTHEINSEDTVNES